MTEAPAVQLQAASKTFANGVKAVDGLTLDIPSNRVLALLGTSGCGKTTTLRLINRLEDATSGAVHVRGRDVRQQRPEELRRSIGYVIQEGGLFPHMTVAANVGAVPRLLGWSRDRIANRVSDILNLVGLGGNEFDSRMPAELSGGQRQRVGVARALAADPDILLMDEPFGALDPATRESIQDQFLALQSRLRKTVVIVTHDMAEAAKLADEIVLMDQGRIVQRGTLSELLLHPSADHARVFFGHHRQALSLEALRLADILDGLVPMAVSAAGLTLPPDLPLGRVLIALSAAAPQETVAVSGTGKVYEVASLRSRILTHLGRQS